MDTLTILLIGSLIGLIVGVFLLSQRHINLYVEPSDNEPQSTGCIGIFLAVLVIIGLLTVLSNSPFR